MDINPWKRPFILSAGGYSAEMKEWMSKRRAKPAEAALLRGPPMA